MFPTSLGTEVIKRQIILLDEKLTYLISVYKPNLKTLNQEGIYISSRVVTDPTTFFIFYFFPVNIYWFRNLIRLLYLIWGSKNDSKTKYLSLFQWFRPTLTKQKYNVSFMTVSVSPYEK